VAVLVLVVLCDHLVAHLAFQGAELPAEAEVVRLLAAGQLRNGVLDLPVDVLEAAEDGAMVRLPVLAFLRDEFTDRAMVLVDALLVVRDLPPQSPLQLLQGTREVGPKIVLGSFVLANPLVEHLLDLGVATVVIAGELSKLVL